MGGTHLPAVKGHFIAAEVDVGIGEEAGGLTQECPQQCIRLIADRVDGPLLASRLLLRIVAVSQQTWIPLSP